MDVGSDSGAGLIASGSRKIEGTRDALRAATGACFDLSHCFDFPIKLGGLGIGKFILYHRHARQTHTRCRA